MQPPFLCKPTETIWLVIRLKRRRLADAGLVAGLGTAECAAELGLSAYFVEKPGIGHSAYLRVFPCHDIHLLFTKLPYLTLIIIHDFSKN